MNRKMKCTLAVLFGIVLLFAVIFSVGRYGWKLGGFRACESAGIEEVTVEENQVHIRGFYPGSFPRGFLGYYTEQVNDTLYVGFKFSGLFGIFETGDFDITIPTDGTVKEIVMKTKDSEYPIKITEVTDQNEEIELRCCSRRVSIERSLPRLRAEAHSMIRQFY